MLSLSARLALLLNVLFVVTAPWRASGAEAASPAATAAFGITQVDLPADKVQAIEQAAPDQAPAKPAKPRKVLVAHYLAGIQFAIGDLKAECTPRVSDHVP